MPAEVPNVSRLSILFAVALAFSSLYLLFRAATTRLGLEDWIFVVDHVVLWATWLAEIAISRRIQPAVTRRPSRHYLVRGVAVLVVSWAIALMVFVAARDVDL